MRPQEAAVVRGMVLGDRSRIPEDLEEAFQRSGITSHTSPVCTRLCAALQRMSSRRGLRRGIMTMGEV